RRKLRVRRTPLKLKSPMRCYSCKMRCTIAPPASNTMPPVATISVPMTTTKLLKDTKDAAKDVAKDVAKDTHLDAVMTMSVPMTTTEKLKDTIHIDAAAQDTFYTEDELQFIGKEKCDKPNYALQDLSKIKRNKYPIYSTFEMKKIDCYLDFLPKGVTCEPIFWDTLYPGGEKAEYLEEGTLDGLVTIDGTNPRYPSWHKISQVFFPINLENKHWVAASWNLDDYVLTIYDSLENCGVMTCKFIEMLTKGKTIDIKSFGDNVGLKCQEYRAKMALMLYETRCERPV
nr:hypothetical protein [Tanacetum cinerariifolium]